MHDDIEGARNRLPGGRSECDARAPQPAAARALARASIGAILYVAAVSGAWAHAWDDRALPPRLRADLVLAELTQEEKLSLVHGGLGAPWGVEPKPPGAIGSAGYVAGVPRLGIPALQETDGELGIADPGNIRPGDTATAMPSDLALASTWDLDLARRQGEAVGAEARAKGFSVLLGGAANLIRDPRGGRNFEYFSEDPLLTGLMAGSAIAGVQSRHVIGTIKHFALNAQETDRVVLDVEIDRAAARESDLLAFEIAIERGRPGSVMCAYNQVNGSYSCENAWLLGEVLKRDWGFPGFVMSDWGAVHSTARAARAGLDQESGEQLDTEDFFERPLAQSIAEKEVPQDRLDDMVRRILTSVFSAGLYDDPPKAAEAPNGSDAIALEIARAGTVLLKNDTLLPLPANIPRIAVIGAHADKGVLSGGGSSEVVPRGGVAVSETRGGSVAGAMIYDPSSPLEAIRRRWPAASITYVDGRDVARAATVATGADVALVFADQWMTETADASDLRLPGLQDALIDGVARANARTVVILETGGPVLMPWLPRVAAVLEAWYPGQLGAEALAEILAGTIDPSGRLPVTFPRGEEQLPRPRLEGDPAAAPPGPVGRGGHYGPIVTADYGEGADVGYKWFERTGRRPLFPFGFGLSYTHFDLRDLAVRRTGLALQANARVRNVGHVAGDAVVEFYVSNPDGSPHRLVGWSKVSLAPAEERVVEIMVDARLLGSFDEAAGVWRIRPGTFVVSASLDAAHRDLSRPVELGEASLPP